MWVKLWIRSQQNIREVFVNLIIQQLWKAFHNKNCRGGGLCTILTIANP